MQQKCTDLAMIMTKYLKLTSKCKQVPVSSHYTDAKRQCSQHHTSTNFTLHSIITSLTTVQVCRAHGEAPGRGRTHQQSQQHLPGPASQQRVHRVRHQHKVSQPFLKGRNGRKMETDSNMITKTFLRFH